MTTWKHEWSMFYLKYAKHWILFCEIQDLKQFDLEKGKKFQTPCPELQLKKWKNVWLWRLTLDLWVQSPFDPNFFFSNIHFHSNNTRERKILKYCWWPVDKYQQIFWFTQYLHIVCSVWRNDDIIIACPAKLHQLLLTVAWYHCATISVIMLVGWYTGDTGPTWDTWEQAVICIIMVL